MDHKEAGYIYSHQSRAQEDACKGPVPEAPAAKFVESTTSAVPFSTPSGNGATESDESFPFCPLVGTPSLSQPTYARASDTAQDCKEPSKAAELPLPVLHLCCDVLKSLDEQDVFDCNSDNLLYLSDDGSDSEDDGIPSSLVGTDLPPAPARHPHTLPILTAELEAQCQTWLSPGGRPRLPLETAAEVTAGATSLTRGGNYPLGRSISDSKLNITCIRSSHDGTDAEGNTKTTIAPQPQPLFGHGPGKDVTRRIPANDSAAEDISPYALRGLAAHLSYTPLAVFLAKAQRALEAGGPPRGSDIRGYVSCSTIRSPSPRSSARSVRAAWQGPVSAPSVALRMKTSSNQDVALAAPALPFASAAAANLARVLSGPNAHGNVKTKGGPVHRVRVADTGKKTKFVGARPRACQAGYAAAPEAEDGSLSDDLGGRCGFGVGEGCPGYDAGGACRAWDVWQLDPSRPKYPAVLAVEGFETPGCSILDSDLQPVSSDALVTCIQRLELTTGGRSTNVDIVSTPEAASRLQPVAKRVAERAAEEPPKSSCWHSCGLSLHAWPRRRVP